GHVVSLEGPIGANRRADLSPAVPDESRAYAEIVRDLALDVRRHLPGERVLKVRVQGRRHGAARDAQPRALLARMPDAGAVGVVGPAILREPRRGVRIDAAGEVGARIEPELAVARFHERLRVARQVVADTEPRTPVVRPRDHVPDFGERETARTVLRGKKRLLAVPPYPEVHGQPPGHLPRVVREEAVAQHAAL